MNKEEIKSTSLMDGYVGPDTPVSRQDITAGMVTPPIQPFPYYPNVIPIEEMKRMEVMMELNKWANNDPFMAKRAAETLIMLLADQFDINILKLNEQPRAKIDITQL